MPEETRRRARRGEGEQLGTEILRATRELLASTGDVHAVSIRAVAQRVGVTAPSIYRHFADKDALVDAVCETVFAELGERMDAAAALAGSPMDRLCARGQAYVRFALDNPEHYRIVLMQGLGDGDSESPWTTAELTASAAFGTMVLAVQECIDAGDLPAGDVTAMVMTLWTSVHGLASLLITKPHFPWPPLEEFVPAVVRVAGLGLAHSQDG